MSDSEHGTFMLDLPTKTEIDEGVFLLPSVNKVMAVYARGAQALEATLMMMVSLYGISLPPSSQFESFQGPLDDDRYGIHDMRTGGGTWREVRLDGYTMVRVEERLFAEEYTMRATVAVTLGERFKIDLAQRGMLDDANKEIARCLAVAA